MKKNVLIFFDLLKSIFCQYQPSTNIHIRQCIEVALQHLVISEDLLSKCVDADQRKSNIASRCEKLREKNIFFSIDKIYDFLCDTYHKNGTVDIVVSVHPSLQCTEYDCGIAQS